MEALAVAVRRAALERVGSRRPGRRGDQAFAALLRHAHCGRILTGVPTCQRRRRERMNPPKDLSRFQAKFTADPRSGCWLWNRPEKNGYGKFLFRGKMQWAHICAYQLMVGEIP